MHLPWSDTDTWDKLRPIAQQAQCLGFRVPTWVHMMADVTTVVLLRFRLEEHARHLVDTTKCDFTHILRTHSSAATDPLSLGRQLNNVHFARAVNPSFRDTSQPQIYYVYSRNDCLDSVWLYCDPTARNLTI